MARCLEPPPRGRRGGPAQHMSSCLGTAALRPPRRQMGRAPESAPAVCAAPSSSSSSSSSLPSRALVYLRLVSAREPMASSEEDGSVEEKETKKKVPRRRGAVAIAWLIFYNIAMTAGWLVLAMAMARFYLENGTHNGLYKSIQKILKFFQTFALLEIIHCAVGLVHTSVLVTWVQVSSRIFMVWFITHSIKQIQNEESVILFLVVWTVTEITRYSFYTFNMLNHLPYFIKWARYNFFIILYPVGVVGELLTIYAALPYVKRSGMFSVRLPNKYNVSFDYYYFLLIIMASYVPLFPQLYFHMLRQRRKVLHGEVIVEKDD